LADLGAPQANDGITQILTPAEPGVAADPDLPRMVRTVTVLPDGTIVNNQMAPADGDAAAANPPQANALLAEPPPAAPPADADPIAVGAIDPPAPAAEPAAEPEPAPAAVVPAPADPAPAAVATPAALTVANLPTAGDPIAPGFYVQVTAQASEQAAQTQLLDFQARVPGLLGSRPAIIQRAELEQGIFYRVKFGPFDARADAIVLLESLREAGIDGFIADHR
jgi:cell division protein FtsN